jgi:sec-independent protein translocase protein TatB
VFDIAWSELALIAAVALIVIGPKDLPRVMRTAGQWVRKARGMAAEFQRNLDDMMREAELDEIRKEVEKVSPAQFKESLEKLVDAKGIETAMQIVDPKPVETAAEPVHEHEAIVPDPEPTPAPTATPVPEHKP